MIRKMLVVSAVAAASAFAGPVAAEKAPTLSTGYSMQCAAGTTPAAAEGKRLGFVGCVDAQNNAHGNTIFIYANGTVEDVGVMNHGHRTGLWKHFDRSGTKVGETTFSNDHFQGIRKTFHANGQVRTVDNWNQGALVGERQYFNAAGEQVAPWAPDSNN